MKILFLTTENKNENKKKHENFDFQIFKTSTKQFLLVLAKIWMDLCKGFTVKDSPFNFTFDWPSLSTGVEPADMESWLF